MIYRAAIFDMDGTLLDTLEDLADSVNEMLEHYSLPRRSLDEVRMFVGNGAKKLMERALGTTDEKFVGEALEYYNGCYARRLLNKTKPYAGILNLLENLNAKEIPVGICTNKQHFAAVALAEKFFAQVEIGAVTGDAKKPNPAAALKIAESFGVAPAEVAYFGDSAVDMQTAINAGFLPVGVTWGFRSEAELVDAGAKIIVHRAEEIFERINFGG